jgi:hypothetical protein
VLVIDLRDMSGKLVDWYWTHGSGRDQLSTLSPLWLDELYRIHLAGGFLAASETAKPCMGVWGPSQSGKSTLISTYMDAPASPDGQGSPLDWSAPDAPEEFARFSRTGETDQRVVCLNPFNHGSDASGCVCRYVLREDAEVADRRHPVEIKFSTPMQIMHALAAGYLSECRPADEVVVWDEASFLGKLEGGKDAGRLGDSTAAGGGKIDRRAFEALRELADVLSLLIRSGEIRYANLGAHGKWDAHLRNQMLSRPWLCASAEAVTAFAQDILWDSSPAMNQVFANLAAKAAELSARWGKRRVYCSLRVASMLLDIDAYKSFLQPSNQRALFINELMGQLSFEESDQEVRIGLGHPNRLINTPQDFGLIQALVRELVVPVRASEGRDHPSAFHRFLERADMLDFPGVALQHQQHETSQIDLGNLPPAQSYRLLTEVLKRGKTASIVAGYAGTFSIDSFSILLRVKSFPAQPRQLISGVELWWKCFNPHFAPHRSPPGRPPLPLNIILTFFGQLVSDVIAGGTGTGLAPVFDRIRKLNVITNPEVATILASNCPQWPDGRIEGAADKLALARQSITGDPDFRKYFGGEVSRRSFEAMLKDGGSDYVFDVAASQFDPAAKAVLLDRLKKDGEGKLRALLEEALPEAMNEAAKRAELMQAVQSRLEAALQTHDWEEARPDSHKGAPDVAAECGYTIRRLLQIDPERLAPVPLNAKKRQINLAYYVLAQYRQWMESLRDVPGLDRLGLDDDVTRGRFLHYLIEVTPVAEVADWLRTNFGFVANEADARVTRNYLATRMSDALWHGSRKADSSQGHPNMETIARRYEQFCKHELGDVPYGERKYLLSPHYTAVIEVFLRLLGRAAEATASGRRPQPGDKELAEMKQLL